MLAHHAHPRQGQRCSACKAEFVFYPHERTGRPAPLIESPNGNIAVNDGGTYRIIKKGESFDGQRYLNHFSDCPAASTFHRDDRRHGR